MSYLYGVAFLFFTFFFRSDFLASAAGGSVLIVSFVGSDAADLATGVVFFVLPVVFSLSLGLLHVPFTLAVLLLV